MIHEPYLYMGTVNIEHEIFVRQADDFASISATGWTIKIIIDHLENKLPIPIKRQGVVWIYKGLDIW